MIRTCRELLKRAMPNISFGENENLPLPEDVPHLFEHVAVPGVHVDVKFVMDHLASFPKLQAVMDCKSCASEPDYRGPCDCAHAPCVHQQKLTKPEPKPACDVRRG